MARALPDLVAMAYYRQGPDWSRLLLGTLAGSALFVWPPLVMGCGSVRAVTSSRAGGSGPSTWRVRAARVEDARAQERAAVEGEPV
ncbi:hypothetical protein [Streptomyces sp. OE57]|uniref:hypothetical protein n=1 Tax=Streptomyces lacaronensis TaxID=3379885 RepID=UPI0039B72318